MHRFQFVLLFILFLTAQAAKAQEPQIDIPPPDRKPYTVGGLFEARPGIVWLDTGAAPFEDRSAAGHPPGARSFPLNGRLELDAGYRRGWFSVQSRTVAAGSRVDGDWSGDARFYEAYVSLKPSPALTVDAGKKTLKWGKGYIWNPAAFLDRPKSPEDPALALEGFTVLSADYIRTFDGPVQVLSLTPVLLPVFGDLNSGFGARGHLNAAAKMYVLLFDTDIDVMVLSGGSRPARVGFDVSRNIRSNLEVHGEWTRISRTPRGEPATSFVVGLRYLTTTETTIIVDYFRNGAGLTPAEMEADFDFGMNPMRNYVYGRVTQPDAFDVVYLTLGASAIVNADDGSVSLLPEVQYKPAENLELRWLASVQRGSRGTEFGEKPADLRIEMRVRYFF